uniref:Uncharacterized protein n=1 Tax=Anguilla anguilla TaxID=7936 RepID=A0A0E9V797_ANGAN
MPETDRLCIDIYSYKIKLYLFEKFTINM